MFQTKFVENTKTHILCSIFFFFQNRAVCETTGRNNGIAGQATEGNIIRRMRIVCRIIKTRIHKQTRALITFNTYCFIID